MSNYKNYIILKNVNKRHWKGIIKKYTLEHFCECLILSFADKNRLLIFDLNCIDIQYQHCLPEQIQMVKPTMAK